METAAETKVTGVSFKRVKQRIKDRNISEVCWELLSIAIDDLEETGSTGRFGKTGLMELVRVISVQKGEDAMEKRMEKVGELKEWLRKAG